MKKLEWCGCPTVKKFRRCLYSFWHNSRTWLTHGHTDTAWRHRPRLCIASRGKNGTRQSYSCNGRLIGCRIYYRLSTFNDRDSFNDLWPIFQEHAIIQLWIFQKRYKIETWLQFGEFWNSIDWLARRKDYNHNVEEDVKVRWKYSVVKALSDEHTVLASSTN